MNDKPKRLRALLLVLTSYVLAIAAAGVTVHLLPDLHPIARVAIADVVATVVIFAFSYRYDNSSFYDAYWSVAPAVIIYYLAFGPYAVDGISVRKWLALLVVSLWAWRLTFHWFRSWTGLHHEDWRYLQFRPKWGRLYWPLSFLGIHLFPTICTFVGSLPLFAAMRSERPVGLLDLVGVAVALAGGVIETIADEQLRRHRREAPSGGVCDVGLWRYSRHPNYFGECTFWLGLWILGAAAEPSTAWVFASGWIAIVGLFLFYSIPVAEARALSRRPAYAEQQKTVSKIVPWFRRS